MNDRYNFSVTVYGNFTKYSETTSLARCRIFYKGKNRNGTFISDEFADKLISSLPYAPIKGIFDVDEKNFGDHGWDSTEGRIYGVVPQEPNFAWEKFVDEDGVEREYACADVIIFTALYPEANHIVGKAQSMELYPPSVKGRWIDCDGTDYFEFTEGCFLGLQVLGTIGGMSVEPCFEGASFFTLLNNINQLLSDLHTQNTKFSKLGGRPMNFDLENAKILNGLWLALNGSEDQPIKYSISQVFDDKALIYNYSENAFKFVAFTVADDTVTLGEFTPCEVLTLTAEQFNEFEKLKEANGGSFDNIAEIRNDKLKAFELKVSELEAENATLITERDELAAYKKGVEDENKVSLLNSYRGDLDASIIEDYDSRKDNFTCEELDKELAYALHKAAKKAEKETPAPELPKQTEMNELDAILSQYTKN